MIYAGRLEEAKGIYRFVEELCKCANKNFRLDIYGEGEDEEKIKQLAAANNLSDKITITRYVTHTELLEKYAAYDWVVLPSSQKDGWGVIVSEGLLNGLKAICSRKCGVSWVIKEGVNGVTFDWAEEGSCVNAISKMFGGGFAVADVIRMSAQRSISGEAGAQYFMKIIDSVYNNKEKPGIPWSGDF